jgi:hypothetical protein
MNMSSNLDFEIINFAELADITGGFDWKSFGGAVGSWGAGGAVAGGIGGAVTGPGAVVGAVAGGAGGAVSGGIYNAGQQFGLWK